MINFLAAHYGPVGDIEVLFSLLALVGAIFSTFSTIEALRDWEGVKRANIGNGRRMLAWTSIQAEAARLIIQIIFLTLGVLAMFLPEAPPSIHLPTLQLVFGIVFRWGLILSSGLLMYKSVLGHITRQRIREEREQRTINGNSEDDPLTRPINNN